MTEQKTESSKSQTDFFDTIGRPDLKGVITETSPWFLGSMELYIDKHGFRGSGGLGILIGDMVRLADRLRVPIITSSPFYSSIMHQNVEGFRQKETYSSFDPEERGFDKLADVSIRVNSHRVGVSLYRSTELPIVGPFEEGFRNVYSDSETSEHRFYQQTIHAFSQRPTLDRLSVAPSVYHLNESSMALSALAVLDQASKDGTPIDQIIEAVRKKVIFTNHTLVPAAIASFPEHMFENYVYSNIQNGEVRRWLSGLIESQKGSINMSILAATLAGKFNGVSRLHSELASGNFYRVDPGNYEMEPINFSNVTNGIDMQRWTQDQLYKIYQENGVVDEFELPRSSYESAVESIDDDNLVGAKKVARANLRSYLATRDDQYGQSIRIPDEAIVACWSKRFAEYKRPGMILEDKDRLKELLLKNNMYILFSGKAHPEDVAMKGQIEKMLKEIDADQVLKERVKYIPDYDEDVADSLVTGVDIWFNTPIIGREACGTSWMKALVNNAILIATHDGGVADVPNNARGDKNYLQIMGDNYKDEVHSLYERMEQAAVLLKAGDRRWAHHIKNQLKAYIPVVAGGRMWRDYINYAFPKLESGNDLAYKELTVA